MTPNDLIEKTWAELGHKIRPSRTRVLVRTETRPYKSSGGLWLPPSTTGIFDKDKTKLDVELFGRVLSVGSGVKSLHVGDRIFFSRLYFAWIKRMEPLGPGENPNYVGFIFEECVFGLASEEAPAVESMSTSNAPAANQSA